MGAIRHLRIYLLEENKDLREALVEVIAMTGFLPTPFELEEELLLATKHSPPRCVLLDVYSPHDKRIELIRDLRWLAPQLPILALTVHGPERFEEALKDCPKIQYLQKPFPIEKLTSILREAGRYLDHPG